MDTQTTEIADGIYRFSTLVPEIGPTGFTFNQYLIDDEQPLLFHTGQRAMFPPSPRPSARITPLDGLRWITFGHVEADECGAMNELLAAAPRPRWRTALLAAWCRSTTWPTARPCHSLTVRSSSSVPHRVRHIDTPHVPHGWEARVLYEETTNTLLCGDLFTQLGNGPATTTDDIVGPRRTGRRHLRGRAVSLRTRVRPSGDWPTSHLHTGGHARILLHRRWSDGTPGPGR